MIQFGVQNLKLFVDAPLLMVPAFRALLEDDSSPDKANGTADLLYVYLLSDYGMLNPLRDLDYNEKESSALRYAYADGKLPTNEKRLELIENARSVYRHLNETSERRLSAVIDKQIDQLRELLDQTKPEIIVQKNAKGETEGFVSNIKLIQEAIREVEKMVKAKVSIEQNLLASNTRAKANQQRSPLETGQIGYKKKEKAA